jgi:hypothetical protein
MCISYKVYFVFNGKCVVRKVAVAHFMYFPEPLSLGKKIHGLYVHSRSWQLLSY